MFESFRINEALGYVQGYLLDVGCGKNLLVQKYKELGDSGLGVDIIDGAADILLTNHFQLPFVSLSIDTVTMVASLNHIPAFERLCLLQETKRVLKKDGRLVVTCIGPFVGKVLHSIKALFVRNYFQQYFGNDQSYGLSKDAVIAYLEYAGFKITLAKSFMFGLNHIYIGEK